MELNYKDFLQNILNLISALGIDISNLEMDHVGYQCSSNKDYESLLPKFQKIGKLLSEELVGNRKVAIFKLHNQIKYKQYVISAVELIEPKLNQICESGLEHVEFVLNEGFSKFLERYPSISFVTSEMNQKDFPMIKLKLNDRYQVKFHLDNVIDIINKKKLVAN